MNTPKTPVFENGTAIIPIDEYNRLRSIEGQYNLVCEDLNTIIIEEGWYQTRRILNPTEAVKIAAEEGQKAVFKYNDLKELRLPMFNFPGKKVKDLL